MKNLLNSIFLFVLSAACALPLCAERVYKEIVIDGEKVNRWMEVDTITEYDSEGREVRRQLEFNGSITTWERNGNMTIEKSVQTSQDYSSKDESYIDENIGRVIYWEHEYSGTYGSGKTETWYEYDSRGNEIHRIEKNSERGDTETYIKIQYDDKGNMIYSKSSNRYGEQETWITYKNGRKSIFIKNAVSDDVPYFSQCPIWIDYDENGRQIRAKMVAGQIGGYASDERVRNVAQFREQWSTYNENGDIIQKKSKTYEEDRNGNVRNEVKDEPTEYYLYDYEYYPNGKLKKKTKYYCKG